MACAVKIVEHRIKDSGECSLSREALLSLSVSHPNVVQVGRLVPCGRDPLLAEGGCAGAGTASLQEAATYRCVSLWELPPCDTLPSNKRAPSPIPTRPHRPTSSTWCA